MTKDEIISMAKEKGFWQEHTNTWMCASKDIERFFQAAYAAGQAAEREACAKARSKPPRELRPVGTGALLDEQQYCFNKGWKEGAASVRAAIRARGNT